MLQVQILSGPPRARSTIGSATSTVPSRFSLLFIPRLRVEKATLPQTPQATVFVPVTSIKNFEFFPLKPSSDTAFLRLPFKNSYGSESSGYFVSKRKYRFESYSTINFALHLIGKGYTARIFLRMTTAGQLLLSFLTGPYKVITGSAGRGYFDL